MIRLRVSLGKNVYENIGWINPQTAQNLGLKEGNFLIESSFKVSPIRIVFSELVRENEISLPSHVMFKIGAVSGEERSFEVVDEIRQAKFAELYVVGVIHDWVDFFRNKGELVVALDDEVAIAPSTSVRVLDIEGASVGEVYRITKDTKIRLHFAGLMNMGIAIDSSRSMLERWKGIRKIDLAKDASKALLEYNLRKTAICAIFSYANDVDILLNWISIDPKLRWFMTVLIPRFVTDMIISETNERRLDEALEYIIEGFSKRNLGKKYLNTIVVFQAGETKVSENRIRDIIGELRAVSNGVWRSIWVGIGDEKFDNLRKIARMFGGKFIAGRTPAGLMKRVRETSDFRHIDGMW